MLSVKQPKGASMVSKLLKWVYKKFLYPKLQEYVQSTDNDYDNKALEFLDDVVDLILLKIDTTIEEIDKQA